MPTTVHRPSGVNVGVNNPGNETYLKGSEFVEGSIRIVPDVTQKNAEFQIRLGGVWNDTGIQIAASTIHIGRDLQVSGAGEWIRTLDIISGISSLIPHVQFSDAGTGHVHTPVLAPKVFRVIFQADESTEFSGTDLQSVRVGSLNLLASKRYFKVGSVGATQEVVLTFRHGTDTSGPIFWQRTIPAATFGTSNSEVEIDLLGLVEDSIGVSTHTQLTSNASLSVKGIASGEWWTALDYSLLGEKNLIQEDLVLTRDAGLVFSRDGDFVSHRLF